MKRLSYALPLALALILSTHDPVEGQKSEPRTVRDEAALFSKEAREKANAVIAKIKRQFHKDLFIETLPTIPFPDDLDKDDAAAVNRYVGSWSAKRFDSLQVDGIYVVIIVSPQRYRIRVGNKTASLFTAKNDKELDAMLLKHLKAKEMDQALLSTVEYVHEMMRRNGLLAAGLQVIDVKAGEGIAANRGDQLVMQYIGRLKDGKTFDKTTEPVTLSLKEGIFIKGFEQGLFGMKAGGVRKLVIPPALAYGKDGVGDIPPNAELHFEIELLKIERAK